MSECLICNEPITPEQKMRDPGHTSRSGCHRECLLRDATGGIGHLIAHDYWCKQMNDPDAGLTIRQSALLVDAMVSILGVEATLDRAPV